MFTNVTTLAARPCESRRSGTAASRLWAAAGVSSDLAGGVKAPCPISKLPENEADTVLFAKNPHVTNCKTEPPAFLQAGEYRLQEQITECRTLSRSVFCKIRIAGSL